MQAQCTTTLTGVLNLIKVHFSEIPRDTGFWYPPNRAQTQFRRPGPKRSR